MSELIAPYSKVGSQKTEISYECKIGSVFVMC